MKQTTPPRGERRAARRKVLEVHIDLHTDSQFFSGFSQDLSDGGVFVATYSPAAIGAELMLEFDLPEGPRVRTLGRVVWVREATNDSVAGMGVSFQKLSADDRSAILKFLELRPPLFYDPDTLS